MSMWISTRRRMFAEGRTLGPCKRLTIGQGARPCRLLSARYSRYLRMSALGAGRRALISRSAHALPSPPCLAQYEQPVTVHNETMLARYTGPSRANLLAFTFRATFSAQ